MILAENEPVDMVKRSIDSVKEYVDGMYITVTYKGDVYKEESPLTQLLHEYGAVLSYFKWVDDFAAARQYALDQVPREEKTYVYWQDADDILDGADQLRNALDTAVANDWAGVFFVYLYRVELDEKGEVKETLIEQQRERIIRNDGTYKWMGMLHETLIGVRQENVQQRLWRKCTVIHLSTDERIDAALERNIKILEKQLDLEKHHDPRTLVYLAKGYYDRGMDVYQKGRKEFIDAQKDSKKDDTEKREEAKENEKKITTERDQWFNKALLLFDEYLSGKGELGTKEYIEQSGWYEERASGWQFVSQIFLIRGNFDKALEAINHAIEEAPLYPQYYLDKAVIYSHMERYDVAKHWLTIATNLEIPKTTLMMNPKDMKVRALECDAHIAMADHDLKRVSKDYRMLLEIAPGNPVYEENLMIAESIDAANKAGQSIVYLGKYLERTGEESKITALLNAVPNDLQKEPFYAQMRHKFVPPRMWEQNELAILCGPGVENWTPNNIDKGIGGSEEAVIYLSQELKKLGWKVTVYAQPGEDEGDYDGVTYLNYFKLNPDDLFNHLILWRNIGFADVKPKHTGKLIVWMHDMPNVPDFTPKRVAYVDKIAVLSEFHKQQVKMYENEQYLPIPENKFFVTRNGIPDLGITNWRGNPHRICYVSSPDRGLIYLLKNWKLVREQVPDAELHVYYGFETFDFLHRNNPSKLDFKRKIMELMKQEGIVYHGRVGHKELAKEMNKCGIWAYPTDFTEISCISAMKAQALGAIPVVTNFAALQETVKNGIRLDVDIQDKVGQKEYVEALVDMMQHPEKQEELRNMKWAQEYFAWSRVAQEWTDLLKGTQVNQTIAMTPEEWQKKLLGKQKKFH